MAGDMLTREGRARYVPLVVAALAAAAVIGGALGILTYSSPGVTFHSETDYGDHFSLEGLLSDAEVVVIATFLGERSETIELPSPATDHSGVFRSDLFRRFRVDESLRGELAPGAEFEAWYTLGVTREARGSFPARTDAYETRHIEQGQTYLLFLREFQREDGPYLGPTAEPSIAEVSGERLRFVAPERYLNEIAVRGLSRPRADSAAPFDVTVSDVRERTRVRGINPE